MRPAYANLVGAGAILRALAGASVSPEADASMCAFDAARGRLEQLRMSCASGRELVEAGYAADVRTASELDVSAVVPQLRSGAYTCS